MIKIAFFDTKEYDKKSFQNHNQNYNYEIVYLKTKLNSETAILAKGCDVVCVFVNDNVDDMVVKTLKEIGVKLIALRCAGFNNIDFTHIDETIKVVRVPEYSPYAVAEHATSLLLALNRKVYKAYQRSKKYNFTLDGLLGYDIHGKTIGVIGTGKIGKVFINIMKGFGAKVIAYDLYPDVNYAKENNFEYCSLEEIFKQSDVISLHCPLTKETEMLINKDSMSKMKDNVTLINTSRGKLVNTGDLIEMMEIGKVGYVGLDVFEDEEEYFLNDMSNSYLRSKELSILLSMPNVVVTSHQAFFTKEALEQIVTTTFENIKSIFENGSCLNEVNIKK